MPGNISVSLAGARARPGAACGARAATYEFLAAPQTDLNRVFRLDKVPARSAPANMASRRQPLRRDAVLSRRRGRKAGPAGEYELIASRHTGEAGVFRVDVRTGFMSICFVLNEPRRLHGAAK